MPILSAAVWDNKGKPYDVSKILTPDFLFDEAAYKEYSRVYLPITYVLSYALQFAALTALLSHTGLWHGRDIWRQWRRSWAEIRKEAATEYQPLANGTEDNGRPASPTMYRVRSSTTSEPEMEDLLTAEDVHNRLMRKYDDVPIAWYVLTGVSMATVGMFVVEHYPVHLPWHGLLLALGIGAILFIPIGIVMAITNQQSSIYLICQLICGVVFPGRPVANMVFTTFGYISSTQGLKFASDLKLGHYMKIPPRILFKLQLSVTIISSLTQIGVLNWMLKNVPGICTPEAINGFNCPIARVHFNGSILWGVVGPKRFFGPGALYRPLVWAFLVGAISPVILWYFARRDRKSILRKVNLAVVFGSLSWIPPATGLNFSVWAIVCYLFNYEVRNRRKNWWKKYNMMLSAALDSGLAFGVVVIFFGIVYPGWMSGFKWWGTEVYKQVGCSFPDLSLFVVANITTGLRLASLPIQGVTKGRDIRSSHLVVMKHSAWSFTVIVIVLGICISFRRLRGDRTSKKGLPFWIPYLCHGVFGALHCYSYTLLDIMRNEVTVVQIHDLFVFVIMVALVAAVDSTSGEALLVPYRQGGRVDSKFYILRYLVDSSNSGSTRVSFKLRYAPAALSSELNHAWLRAYNLLMECGFYSVVPEIRVTYMLDNITLAIYVSLHCTQISSLHATSIPESLHLASPYV